MPTPAEITKHHDPIPGQDPWIEGRRPAPSPIDVVDYDECWPAEYARIADVIRTALGPIALDVEHVGSTSVPGLAAKPTIDVDLTVANPADEALYVAPLEQAGFVLVIREPAWHEHRCLVRYGALRVNLHVFGPDCPEIARHRMFRDWLRTHPEDRALYEQAKREAATATTASGGMVQDYNKHKESVLRAIYDRMFRANGLL